MRLHCVEMRRRDPSRKRSWVPAAVVGLIAVTYGGAHITGHSVGVTDSEGCGGGAPDPARGESVAVQPVTTTLQPGLHKINLDMGRPNQWCSDPNGQGPTGVTTWYRPGTEARCVWDDDDDHTSGNGRSIRLEPETAHPGINGLATVRYVVSGLLPGQTHKFSAWVRSRSRTPAMLFMSGVTNPNNPSLAASTVSIDPSKRK
jgi:hypothetical protein